MSAPPPPKKTKFGVKTSNGRVLIIDDEDYECMMPENDIISPTPEEELKSYKTMTSGRKGSPPIVILSDDSDENNDNTNKNKTNIYNPPSSSTSNNNKPFGILKNHRVKNKNENVNKNKKNKQQQPSQLKAIHSSNKKNKQQQPSQLKSIHSSNKKDLPSALNLLNDDETKDDNNFDDGYEDMPYSPSAITEGPTEFDIWLNKMQKGLDERINRKLERDLERDPITGIPLKNINNLTDLEYSSDEDATNEKL